MTAIHDPDEDCWCVVDDGGQRIGGPFDCERDALEWIDQQETVDGD